MLQPNNILALIITFTSWSWCSLNGVVSDPQTNLVNKGCTPSLVVLSNSSIFNYNVNKTFQDIREQLLSMKKHFVTAEQANPENPVFTLFQCRNYLSFNDCVACFNFAAAQILECPATAQGGRAVYDGCFLRYETNAFFDQTQDNFNAVLCGNQTARESSTTLFTSVVQQVLVNLQTTTPKTQGFFVATKAQLPDNNNNNNGTIIYAFAQCVETISQSGCEDCLKTGYSNLQTCLPNSNGKTEANGCFMRYSTTSFFPHNQTFHILQPLIKQVGANKKGAIVGVVVGGVAFVLILLILLAWIKRPKGLRYQYLEVTYLDAENKLGEGGFGAVYKGTLKNGKLVAVKKLTLRQSKKVDKEFESEVKLISNVHHRNLIRLLGCCSEGNERILIYEYMKNTSLDKFLFGKNRGSLGWKQRYDIILGTARGLAYLHEEFDVRIIHRDIKTNNILLDDDLQPKIADFGLARVLPEEKSHLTTKFAGTLGYTAPEYAIHVLEIITGERSNELNINSDREGAFLLQTAWKLYERGLHIELADDTLDLNEYETEEVKKIIEIGLLCTQASTELRPSMSEVIVLLQGNRNLLENMKPTMPILIET
ncbi:hypothetical protein K1719_044910 [Acacia pycnantha]|nr:hypothetical protein K1719_044910 [Acacia pycnantha]